MESHASARSRILYLCLPIIVTIFFTGIAVPASADFTLTIYEQTGSINTYTFNQNDHPCLYEIWQGCPGRHAGVQRVRFRNGRVRVLRYLLLRFGGSRASISGRVIRCRSTYSSSSSAGNQLSLTGSRSGRRDGPVLGTT